jgi:N-methylhydantoinase A/oxoprolinase/acetone carboxylase beta subunit
LAGIDLKKEEGAAKSFLVVDVGGTTTDIGVLLPSGFPRQAAAFIEGLCDKDFASLNLMQISSC